MQKQCQKCRKKVSDELFICPYCGAIFGDPVHKPAPVSKKAKVSAKRIPRRNQSFAWIGPALMVLVVLSVALVLPQLLRRSAADAETTAPTYTTNAPLVTYNVQIKASDRSSMKGVLIEIYLGDRMIDSCLTSLYGKASFTLPQNDQYRLRLRELPIKYQFNYGDTDFTFPDGQQNMIISLENKPISYIVKVVNADGNPLPKAGVRFHMLTDSTLQITDENGCCVFEALYQELAYGVTFDFPPTGYAAIDYRIKFEAGSRELTITLPTIEENAPEGKIPYTVRVVDEYGQPVTDTHILAMVANQNAAQEGNFTTAAYGILNPDGWFSFYGYEDQAYSIVLTQLPDYSDAPFHLGTRFQDHLIQLDLEREEYIYTVYVKDYYGNPNPGIELYYQDPYSTSGEDICYTSDENAIVTIICNEPDPTKVILYTLEKDGNFVDRKEYTFPYYSRKLEICVYERFEERIYTVKVQDQNGNPVVGAHLIMHDSMRHEWSALSDQDGICIFYLTHDIRDLDMYWLYIQQLPDGYIDPIIAPQMFAYGSREMTLTVVSTAEST